ncbi:F-box/LRR-repeat protein 14 [Dorcoceras hygrometricum]|uniref:F-box/LRR-repeat protein 14 n=1 Tax=Dorcoceras hygrometricum TaxID=472368 RepID=A0A2Z6ZYM3_9LAMI|nr:F-box/LRR-repeat protein 14 [Dorcoceras hygrometricum]
MGIEIPATPPRMVAGSGAARCASVAQEAGRAGRRMSIACCAATREPAARWTCERRRIAARLPHDCAAQFRYARRLDASLIVRWSRVPCASLADRCCVDCATMNGR